MFLKIKTAFKKHATPAKLKLSNGQKAVPEQEFPKCFEHFVGPKATDKDKRFILACFFRVKASKMPKALELAMMSSQVSKFTMSLIWAFESLQYLTDTLKTLSSFYKRHN